MRNYFKIENTPPTHIPQQGNGPKFGDGPDLPLKVKDRIFEYGVINKIIKLKDVLHTFVDYVQYDNFLLFQKIMVYLDKIICGLRS